MKTLLVSPPCTCALFNLSCDASNLLDHNLDSCREQTLQFRCDNMHESVMRLFVELAF